MYCLENAVIHVQLSTRNLIAKNSVLYTPPVEKFQKKNCKKVEK